MGITSFYNKIKEIKKTDPSLCHINTEKLFFDVIWCHYRYGVSIAKYSQYEFYRLNRFGRKNYVSDRYGKFIYDTCNPKDARYITAEKAAFNSRYEAFIHRRFLDVATASYDEFCAFVDNCDRFITKPMSGTCGKGIEVVECTPDLSKEDLYQQYKSSSAVLEEVVVQHPEMARLHPESLNSIRMTTLRDDDRVTIVGCALRMGTGKEVVDNFHKNGIVAGVDAESGVVNSTGINYRHQRFVRHPDTGTQIIGFQIPLWDKVKETCLKAADMLPEMDCVGWDLAINSAGDVLLIEGNSLPDFNILQMPCKQGLYYRIKPIIDKKLK